MAFNRTYNAAKVDKDRGTGCLPADIYEVQITAASECISKKTGINMIKLEITVISGKYKNNKLWYYICDDQWADQKVYDIVVAAAGKPEPKMIHPAIFAGLTARVKTKTRVYNGEESAEINYWCRLKTGEQPPAAPENRTATPQAEEENKNTDVDVDDIPF